MARFEFVGLTYTPSLLEKGDIVTFGDDPQEWRVVVVGTNNSSWRIVPIDAQGNEIPMEEYRKQFNSSR